MVGTLNPKDWPDIHTSPFGAVPESTSSKWRLITTLSAPLHYSVTDGIGRVFDCKLLLLMMLYYYIYIACPCYWFDDNLSAMYAVM